MTTAVVLRRGGTGDAFAAAGGLVLSAAMTVLVPVLGAVRASDGSAIWSAPGAVWVALLPALVSVGLAARRPVVALAVAAGAGILGGVRLLADLPVITSPDSIARPDLFVETTDRSLPFHGAAGGYLLLAADAVALGAGVVAALRLAGRLSFQRLSDLDPAEPDESGPPPRRNHLMTAAGFLGVLLLAIGALTVSYQGGYLTGRYVAVGVPLTGMIAAVLLAVLAATAVLVAGSLPRALAVGLLGGVAIGAGIPFLAAVVAAVTAPVQLSVTVWLALAGGVLLAAAGLLARVRLVRVADHADRVAGPPRGTAIAAGVTAIAAAGLALAAFALPQLDTGDLDIGLTLADGSPMPGTTLFAVAAIPLAIAGVLALIGRVAGPGRTALMVLWAGLVPALMQTLAVLGDDRIATGRLLGIIGVGAGTWCGTAALVLAVVSAALAAVTSQRVAQACPTVPDDESVAAVRAVSVPVAAAGTLLTVVLALVPMYATAGQTQGPTILHGYTVEAWGVWAQLLATVGALAAAAVTRRAPIALAAGLAAVAVQGLRLVVPGGVPDAAGFSLRPGFWAQAAAMPVLIVAAVALAVLAGRVRELDPPGPAAAPRVQGASSQAGVRAGRTPRPADRGSARAGSGAARAGSGARGVPRGRRRRR